MDLDTPAGTVFVGALTFTFIGLLVYWIAGTRASVVLGIRKDAPWLFRAEGVRAQGVLIGYLGLVVAVGAAAFSLMSGWLGPDARALSWTVSWVSAVLVLAVTVLWFGRLLIHVATGGKGIPDEPEEGDFVEPDDALDDVDVRSARQAALAGDWGPAAHLLAATSDHDARFGRLFVLAATAVRRGAWLEAWLRARPRDPNALALRAQAAALRAWEIRGGEWAPQNPERFLDALADAETYAREAIEVTPTDPSPHVTLVTLARGQQVDAAEFERRFAGVLALAPAHRQGHEQALQFRCAKWFGSSEEMFAFARVVSERARPGSALCLLVVIAHVEHAMMLTQRGGKFADTYMESDATRAEIAAAERRWRSGPDGPSPVGRAEAHNLLAYAWWLAEDPAA
ncbi:MAG TPA: hypothetical protein VGK35_10605, partial [Actinotalea sp.]